MKRSFHSNFALSLSLALAPLAMVQVATAQTPTPVSVARAAKGASWIEVRATLDKPQYTVGEPIKVTLRATNIQSRDAYLKYSSGQRFELKLFRVEFFRSSRASASKPVYIWSANKNFAMMVSHVQLKQGESEVYQGEIGGEMGVLQPGLYRLEAQLANSSQIQAPPVVIRVVPVAVAKVPQAKLSAATKKSLYRVGETIDVDCVLRNNPDAPTTFSFGSGQTYDILIRNAAGEAVWNWAANKRFIMVSRPVTLAAGEQQKFTVQWDGQALPDYEIKPGRYTIEAIYASTPAVRAAPISIEIK